jgi:hypothetical protein
MVANDILLRGHQASCREIGRIVLEEWDFACTMILYETALAFERLAGEVHAEFEEIGRKIEDLRFEIVMDDWALWLGPDQ